MKGLIIKGIGGFYYVKDEKTGDITQCRGRGAFKNSGITLCVGDNVIYDILEDGDGIIEEIIPRKNHFIRPPICNVDLIVVVTAAAKPKPIPYIIDKFLVMAEKSNTKVLMCITKTDIAKEKDVKALLEIYKGLYDIVAVNIENDECIDEIKSKIKGMRTAFAGPSGVGKSTLINRLLPDKNLEVGDISHKTKRGKHTTRHVEIFNLDEETMIYDTPGFTSFDILEAEETELQHYYPEMEPYLGRCKYDDCIHIKEPDCKVLEAVSDNKINSSRYDSYKKQIEEIKNKKKY